MDTFKIGEIAVLVDTGAAISPAVLQYLSTDVEIIGPLQPDHRLIGNAGYPIRFNDGLEAAAVPWALRKKPPLYDGRDVTRWQDCPWQPETVRA